MKERDVVARVVAAGSILIAGALTAHTIFERRRVDAMEAELARQRLVDCMQTDFTGTVYSLPPLDPEQCSRLEDTFLNNPVWDYRKPTPTPSGSGG